MKTKSLLLLAAMSGGTIMMNAQELAPGINYSYTPPGSDGIIHSISVDVVNNDNNAAGSFDVAMYLYDQSTTNVYVIGTTNIPSLSGNSLITISNWDIDINSTPGIPAGTYRLGVWVDSNEEITEQDESDNAGLLSGNINYTPSASGIAAISVIASGVKCFPNPANEQVTFAFTLQENAPVSMNVYDMTGHLVKIVIEDYLVAGDYSWNVTTSELPAGMYFVTLSSGETRMTSRLTVTH